MMAVGFGSGRCLCVLLVGGFTIRAPRVQEAPWSRRLRKSINPLGLSNRTKPTRCGRDAAVSVRRKAAPRMAIDLRPEFESEP
jgi:hypothetical protein